MTINGTVLIDPSIPTFQNATVIISLEDVGRVDAGADILQREIIENVSHREGQRDVIEFTLTSNESDNQHPRYNLRCHVDLTGNRSVEVGDLVTTRSTPVTPGSSESYELTVSVV